MFRRRPELMEFKKLVVGPIGKRRAPPQESLRPGQSIIATRIKLGLHMGSTRGFIGTNPMFHSEVSPTSRGKAQEMAALEELYPGLE